MSIVSARYFCLFTTAAVQARFFSNLFREVTLTQIWSGDFLQTTLGWIESEIEQIRKRHSVHPLPGGED